MNLTFYCYLELITCQYLQLETKTEQNTELIAVDVVDFEAQNEITKQKKNHDPALNICATTVKVISKFTLFNHSTKIKVCNSYKFLQLILQ